ncbi:hypothetical protein MMC28_011510 [Mycoblastus sanguinarius]|nr:hypothetical protein [Mycoblastus sanguinarius]
MDETTSLPPKLSLLGMPRKVRNKIYRFLLRNDRPIGYPSGCQNRNDDFGWDLPLSVENYGQGKFDLAFPMLQVCHQVYDEGSPILYSENTFAFKIRERFAEERAEFLGWRGPNDHIAYSKGEGVPVEKIERYVIKVELESASEFEVVRRSIRMTCAVLSQSFKLRQLDIELEAWGVETFESLVSKETYPVSRILQPFAMLRNVQTVHFKGVPLEHASEGAE